MNTLTHHFRICNYSVRWQILLLLIISVNASFAQKSFYLNRLTAQYHYQNSLLASGGIFFRQDTVITKTDYFGKVLWSKEVRSLYTWTVSDDAIYYINEAKALVKLDSSGNLIWARNVSGSTCAPNSSVINYYSSLVVNHDRLYISVQGGDGFGTWYYNSILTFDTAGIFINSMCENGYTESIRGGFPRLEGGAWFVFSSGGVGNEETIVPFDRNGNVDSTALSIFMDMGVSISIQDIIPFSDSSYLAIGNTDPNGMFYSYYDYHFGLSKFRKDGTVEWQQIISAFRDTAIGALKAGIDGGNNIYIIGYVNNDIVPSPPFLMKLDSAGKVIYCFNWSQFNFVGSTYDRILITDSIVYCPVDVGAQPIIYVFDSSFTNSCANSSSPLKLIQSADPIWTSSRYQMDPYNFPQIDTTVKIVNATLPNSITFCEIVSVPKSEAVEKSIIVYPNPATNTITITSPENIERLWILNVLGEEVFHLDAASNQESTKLNIETLPHGLYFMHINIDGNSLVEKFTKID